MANEMKVGSVMQIQGGKFLADGTQVELLESSATCPGLGSMWRVRVLNRRGLDALWYVEEKVLRPLEQPEL